MMTVGIPKQATDLRPLVRVIAQITARTVADQLRSSMLWKTVDQKTRDAFLDEWQRKYAEALSRAMDPHLEGRESVQPLNPVPYWSCGSYHNYSLGRERAVESWNGRVASNEEKAEQQRLLSYIRACRIKFGDCAVNEAILEYGPIYPKER